MQSATNFSGYVANALLAGVVLDCPYVSFVPKFPVDICVAAFCSVKLLRGRRVFVSSVSRRICRICPDCSSCYGLFMYSLTVEIIFWGFGEQEDIFMGFRTSVFYTFRHGVGLCPIISCRRNQPSARNAKASIQGMPMRSFFLYPSNFLIMSEHPTVPRFVPCLYFMALSGYFAAPFPLPT